MPWQSASARAFSARIGVWHGTSRDEREVAHQGAETPLGKDVLARIGQGGKRSTPQRGVVAVTNVGYLGMSLTTSAGISAISGALNRSTADSRASGSMGPCKITVCRV